MVVVEKNRTLYSEMGFSHNINVSKPVLETRAWFRESGMMGNRRYYSIHSFCRVSGHESPSLRSGYQQEPSLVIWWTVYPWYPLECWLWYPLAVKEFLGVLSTRAIWAPRQCKFRRWKRKEQWAHLTSIWDPEILAGLLTRYKCGSRWT